MEATGFAGMLVVLVTLPLLLAGFVCLIVRVPRWVAVALVIASGVPLVIGAAGMALARVETDKVLATLKNPEPQDRACGDREAEFHLILGLSATLLAFAASLPALARSRKRTGPVS